MQTEVDLQVLKVVVSKLDETLDKISESTISINRLLTVHDGRIEHLEKDTEDNNRELKDLYFRMENNTKEILKEMKEVESRIENQLEQASDQSSSQHKSLSDKVDKLDERIGQLEQWRWYVAGGLALVAFLITNSATVSKFIH